MSLLKRTAEDGGYVVTAKPYDGLFKADLIDTQIGDKGDTRKFVGMIYLCLDSKVVSITKDGEILPLADVRKLDIFNPEEATQLYTIGHLIEEVITPSVTDEKK